LDATNQSGGLMNMMQGGGEGTTSLLQLTEKHDHYADEIEKIK